MKNKGKINGLNLPNDRAICHKTGAASGKVIHSTTKFGITALSRLWGQQASLQFAT
jgi:hypothetical protein